MSLPSSAAGGIVLLPAQSRKEVGWRLFPHLNAPKVFSFGLKGMSALSAPIVN